MNVTTNLPKEIAEQLSAAAEAAGKTREAIVSQAVIEYLASRRHFKDKTDVLTQLESLLAEGIESGEAIPVDSEFWERKRRRVASDASRP
jgi:predicted transcriptional regulator